MARRKRKKRVYDSAGQARRLARAVIGSLQEEKTSQAQEARTRKSLRGLALKKSSPAFLR